MDPNSGIIIGLVGATFITSWYVSATLSPFGLIQPVNSMSKVCQAVGKRLYASMPVQST